MAVKFDLDLDHSAIQRMLKSPTGEVGRFIFRLGAEYVQEARRRAPVARQGGGALKRSIGIMMFPGPGLMLEAGANIEYAMSVHDGQPSREITPKRAKVLKFPSKTGQFIYRPRSHPGPTKPNPFLWDALVDTVNRGL